MTLKSQGGLRVLGHRIRGVLDIYLRGQEMMLTDHRHLYLLCAKATITSLEDNEMIVSLPDDRLRTMGVLSLTARPGSMQLVNTIPAEVYVLGVIEPELGSVSLAPDSLRAQIVASRSYEMSMRGRHSSQGYDFCDNAHCQMFRGTEGIRPELLAASTAVKGKYLSYGGRPIPAFYHDSCGGMTAAADDVWPLKAFPYLRPIKDGASEAYCRYAPRAHWRFEAGRRPLQECLIREGLVSKRQTLKNISVIKTDASGRALTVGIVGGRMMSLSGAAFRRMINRSYGSEVLPSTLFTVSLKGPHVVIEGRGWGHGVGLCQWGAIEMAREGKTYEEILQHYFPGTTLEQIPVPVLARASRQRAG